MSEGMSLSRGRYPRWWPPETLCTVSAGPAHPRDGVAGGADRDFMTVKAGAASRSRCELLAAATWQRNNGEDAA
jgi:hypothetical protein